MGVSGRGGPPAVSHYPTVVRLDGRGQRQQNMGTNHSHRSKQQLISSCPTASLTRIPVKELSLQD